MAFIPTKYRSYLIFIKFRFHPKILIEVGICRMLRMLRTNELKQENISDELEDLLKAVKNLDEHYL